MNFVPFDNKMEVQMIEENGTQRLGGQRSTSWWVIIAAAILLTGSLGALIYFFVISAP
jgi:hypothetical protein